MLPIAPNLSHAESKRKPTNAELTGRQPGWWVFEGDVGGGIWAGTGRRDTGGWGRATADD
jgi:hypothetical protein